MVEIYGFKFTLDEVKQIVNEISDSISKKTNDICLLLNVTNEFMIDWYNAIVDAFIAVEIRGGINNLTDTESFKHYKLINLRTYGPTYEILIHKLGRVHSRWEDGELSRQINSGDVMKKIDKIRGYLDLFWKTAMEKKELFRKLKLINPETWGNLSVQDELDRYKSELMKISVECNKLRLELQPELGCRDDEIKALLKEYQQKEAVETSVHY